MTWEQKLQACQALCEHTLRMRKPGDWYVDGSVDVKRRSCLEARFGNGRTPEEAVEDHWKQLTELEPGQYLVIKAYGEDRQAVEWNGFMWTTVRERQLAGGRDDGPR